MLLASAGAVRADAPDAAADADRMVDLFGQTCLAMTGDAGEIRHAAGRAGMKPLGGAAAKRLLVRPGIVFDASAGGDPLALLSFDDGLCGVAASGVDATRVLVDLAFAMRRAGFDAKPVGTRHSGTSGTYALERGDTHLTLMVGLHGSGSDGRASLLLEPSR